MANAELPCWDVHEVGWLQETDLPKLPSLIERGRASIEEVGIVPPSTRESINSIWDVNH
jgi:hypothetical protein